MSIVALCNSSAVTSMLDLISPTLNYEVSKIGSLPLADGVESDASVESIANQAVDIAERDWDSFETSWGFKRHPLI